MLTKILFGLVIFLLVAYLSGLYRWVDINFFSERMRDATGRYLFHEDWSNISLIKSNLDYSWLTDARKPVLIGHALGASGVFVSSKLTRPMVNFRLTTTVDRDNPDLTIIHRGKAKSLGEPERKLIKRRNAVEPVIGHLKADHRMDRCHLKGEIGDRLHAVLCAAGYNLRWLFRAIARKGLGVFFLLLPPELIWAIRRHLSKSFLRISPERVHEMAPV